MADEIGRPGYLPASIRGAARVISRRLPNDSDERYRILRLLEHAYAEGYGDGFIQGIEEGYDAAAAQAVKSDG